ncbi:uncharacterized protein FN964_001832 [Alca torda]
MGFPRWRSARRSPRSAAAERGRRRALRQRGSSGSGDRIAPRCRRRSPSVPAAVPSLHNDRFASCSTQRNDTFTQPKPRPTCRCLAGGGLKLFFFIFPTPGRRAPLPKSFRFSFPCRERLLKSGRPNSPPPRQYLPRPEPGSLSLGKGGGPRPTSRPRKPRGSAGQGKPRLPPPAPAPRGHWGSGGSARLHHVGSVRGGVEEDEDEEERGSRRQPGSAGAARLLPAASVSGRGGRCPGREGLRAGPGAHGAAAGAEGNAPRRRGPRCPPESPAVGAGSLLLLPQRGSGSPHAPERPAPSSSSCSSSLLPFPSSPPSLPGSPRLREERGGSPASFPPPPPSPTRHAEERQEQPWGALKAKKIKVHP